MSKQKTLTPGFTMTFKQASDVVSAHTDKDTAVVARVRKDMSYATVKQADYINAIHAAYDEADVAIPAGFSVPTLKHSHATAANLHAKGVTVKSDGFAKLAVAGVTIVRASKAAGGGVMALTDALVKLECNVDEMVALAKLVNDTHNELRRKAPQGAVTRGAGKAASEKGADEATDEADEPTVTAVVEPATISLSTVSTDRLIHELTARILTGGKFTPAQVTLFDALFDAHAVAFDELVAA